MAESPLDGQIHERIEALSYLPTTIAVAMKFVELGRNPEADPAEYARVVSSDASLSTKLLSLANSSWFGVRNKVTKPQVAVNLLGLGTVRTLALSYCLTGLHHELRIPQEVSKSMWSAALCKAVVARKFAMLVDPGSGDEAFAAGMFQDFALPIMYACAGDRVTELLNDPTTDVATRLQRERAIFRLDHAEIGRMIAQKLELPELYVDAVAFHHNKDSLGEFVARPALADAVYAASLFPHKLNIWCHADVEAFRAFFTSHPRTGTMDMKQFLDEVQEEFNRVHSYFEQSKETSPQTKLVELVEAAAREVADNTTRMVGTVQQMMVEVASAGKQFSAILKEHTQLMEAVERDALTGNLTRECFAARAAETARSAAKYRHTLAVLFIDADRFKQVNDQCGHDAGDRALALIGHAIQGSIRAGDFAGRLGGDEFAVILDNCSQADALRVAERIRVAIADTPVSLGNQTVTMGLSIGLLLVDGDGASRTAEELLMEADKLMYQAKRGGGNRVCQGALSAAAA